MLHFSECSTVAANCNTETEIEMRDGTVEHFPECVLGRRDLGPRSGFQGRREGRSLEMAFDLPLHLLLDMFPHVVDRPRRPLGRRRGRRDCLGYPEP